MAKPVEKQTVKLNDWEEKALYFMKLKGNGQQIGYMLRKEDPASEIWWKYFINKGMKQKAQYLASRMRQDKDYMVPCQDPNDLDPAYRPPAKPRMPYKDE